MTKYLGAVIGLVLTHAFFGRLISVPYGMALTGKWYWATLLILSLDTAQVSMAFYIMDRGNGRWRLKGRIRLLHRRFRHRWESLIKRKSVFRRERRWHSRLLRRSRTWGKLGVVLITSLPFIGGGIWSGILLARLLRISPGKRLMLLLSGSLTGCLFLSLGLHGMTKLVKGFYFKILYLI